jgi:hypothetical protein
MSPAHPCEIQNKRILTFKKLNGPFCVIITQNCSLTDIRLIGVAASL